LIRFAGARTPGLTRTVCEVPATAGPIRISIFMASMAGDRRRGSIASRSFNRKEYRGAA
jgi:hypothetical protein